MNVETNVMDMLHLSDIAHGRSGDKGNHANIAVIAYTLAGFAWLRQHLTAEVVQRYFHSLNPSRVVRYEAANLLAVNFVLYDVLAGGASRSLRIDTQGKTLALALLRMPLPSGEDVSSMLRPTVRTNHER
ncbi:MAG: AtuA-related protein [Gemmataceae bacterium]